MGSTKGAFVVTPTLLVGMPLNPIVNVWEAFSPHDAVKLIKQGKIAALGKGRWDQAERTLALLGMSPEQIEDRLHFAQTGEVLYPDE